MVSAGRVGMLLWLLQGFFFNLRTQDLIVQFAGDIPNSGLRQPARRAAVSLVKKPKPEGFAPN